MSYQVTAKISIDEYLIIFQNNKDESNYAAVNIFLTTLGLGDLIPIFKSERIDSHVLHYLEDDDLKAGCQKQFEYIHILLHFNEKSSKA